MTFFRPVVKRLSILNDRSANNLSIPFIFNGFAQGRNENNSV